MAPYLAGRGDDDGDPAGAVHKGAKMSECENPVRRNGDKSRMAALANNAAFTLASRGALVVVMGLVAFIAYRSLGTLDKMAAKIEILSEVMIASTTKLDDHARRIEKVENKVFK